MLILGPIVFFALLQGAFLPLNLVLLTFITYLAYTWAAEESPEKIANKAFSLAFLTGIVLDLTSVSLFGLHALIFLVLTVAFLIYARSFDPTRPWFLAGFVFFADIVLGGQGLILAILALLVGGVFAYLIGGVSPIRLKR